MRRLKFGWWAPWQVTRPWLPHGWLGTDEWHNPAVSVVVPFLGAFHVWFGQWRDDTEGHFALGPVMDAPDCPDCLASLEGRETSWWSPPRP